MVFCISFFAASTARAQTHALGGRALSADEYDSIPLAPSRPMGRLPPQLDLSGSFPPPGNQGAQPSCTAWAVAYALKTYQEREERGWELTPEHIFSPAFFYNQLKPSPRVCEGGISFPDALNLLTSTGALPLQVMPYDPATCTARPRAELLPTASQYRASVWRRVNFRDPSELKSQLAARLPVLLSLSVDEGFDNLRAAAYARREGTVYSTPHAVVLVGYDDARGAWRILNSWGTAWGDGGYAWIDYEVFPQIAKEAYEVLDEVSTDTTDTADTTVTPTPPAPRPSPTPPRPGETEINYTDGGRFVGSLVGGKREGRGVLTWVQGDRYEGDFHEDRREGRGVYTWPNGNRYEGDFRDNKLHGRGVFTTQRGYRYEGEFVEDLRHGRGTETLVDGTRYEGSFERGERHGRGVMTFTDGSRYDGGFRQGQWEGEGVFVGANGQRYEGHFHEGRFDGYGVFRTTTGNRYEGEFRQGRYQGQGTYQWTDGERLEGFFRDGNPVMGVRIRVDGSRLQGRFDTDWHFTEGYGVIVYDNGSRWTGGIAGDASSFFRHGAGLYELAGRHWLGVFNRGRCLRWVELRPDGSVTPASCQ
jgi:hypothetical protein